MENPTEKREKKEEKEDHDREKCATTTRHKQLLSMSKCCVRNTHQPRRDSDDAATRTAIMSSYKSAREKRERGKRITDIQGVEKDVLEGGRLREQETVSIARSLLPQKTPHISLSLL